MSNPGASWVSVPSTVASARNAPAISGGTDSWCSARIRNRPVKHPGVRGDSGADVAGHELAEGALERRLVELLGPLHDVKQRVVQRRGIAPVHGEQQALKRGSKAGVDSSDGAEVEQA